MLITSEKDEHIYHLILNWWQLQEITNGKLWLPLHEDKYTTHTQKKKKKKKKPYASTKKCRKPIPVKHTNIHQYTLYASTKK
jgi:hypothetical protein